MLRADAYSFIICSRHALRVVGGRVEGGYLKEFNGNLLSGVYEVTGNDAASMLQQCSFYESLD